MANTINGFPGNNAPSLTTERSAGTTNRTPQSPSDSTSSAATANTPAAGANEEVQITSTAAQLASLGQKLSSQPAVDHNRVARLTQALADGSYKISPEKIASGLMQSDHALAQIGLS
jgi:negative regulator of flagellin synthesis FlgM